jgi:hypothetical protein
VLSAATVAVKPPPLWLAAIPMLAGTVTLVLLLDSATVAPPAGAGADKVIVQAELPGAFTVPGAQLRPLGTTVTVAVRFTVVDWLWPFSVAVTVAVWFVATVPLVAVNVALLCPAATVTAASTGSAALLLLSETTVALATALLSDTVQLLLALPARLVGEHDTDVRCAGALAVSVKVWVPPPKLATSRADWSVLTAATLAVKLPLV